ncbi:hypothetical protein FRACA_1550014 [Frankia canadensis]|uniref:Rad50/SbcC-type AAA domain-containing protein n=1 Tax=Frankia canadensis TaxID=1836972 RepID=A0A2I2KM93_9ACTN|nr:AAA family ATPase [Frankia canadensis]SNQ46784.1 hypothetical protein FRACA_1550014 [Frankia canadensis]SOU54074.1 hypothetical protein FRACA_1550014 [Frankia canadensis]
MLTRIEIDGFKTFHNFSLDLSPFLVIVGQNASGKSNLFDAIRLIGLLAESDLRSAFAAVRGGPVNLFRRESDETSSERITIAVEVVLDSALKDPWGSDVRLTHTRIRYEVAIEQRRDDDGNERLYVASEFASPIRSGRDRARSSPLRYWATPAFQARQLRYRRRDDLLSGGEDEQGRPVFKIHNDGVQGRPRPAFAAERTVLSTIVTAEFRHLYALREELPRGGSSSWIRQRFAVPAPPTNPSFWKPTAETSPTCCTGSTGRPPSRTAPEARWRT